MTVAPPDAAAALCDLLAAPCSSRLPAPDELPTEYTRITSAGGDDLNLIQGRPRLMIECWAATDTKAFDRARAAWAAIQGVVPGYIAPGVYVTRARLSLPADFPDTEASRPRAMFTAQLTVSHTEVTE